MRVPVLFGWVMIFVVVVSYKRHKADRERDKTERDFWDRENTANATRKQDISNLDYVDFTSVTLPFALFSDDLLKQCEEQVLKLKDEKILNLTGISNTDLKLAYGAANLPLLTQYDQNFTLLVRTLNTWGHRLKGSPTRKKPYRYWNFPYPLEVISRPHTSFLLNCISKQENRKN